MFSKLLTMLPRKDVTTRTIDDTGRKERFRFTSSNKIVSVKYISPIARAKYLADKPLTKIVDGIGSLMDVLKPIN